MLYIEAGRITNMVHIQTYEDKLKEECLRSIKSTISCKECTEEQREVLSNYNQYSERKNLSLQGRRIDLVHLKNLLLALKKDLSKLKKEDIDRYLREIDQKYKPKTIGDKRILLIKLLKWYFKKKKEDIPLIEDLKVNRKYDFKLPEQMISPQEIREMIRVAENPRDKAIVSLLYETAARVGEFLRLRIKHIQIDRKKNALYGFVIVPKGKTVSRKLPIIYSLPYVIDWLNQHPFANDKEAPLFVGLRKRNIGLGNGGVENVLKYCSNRAGIQKRVHPHLLRHSRMSELAKELTQQELCVYGGWTMGSIMVRTYIHLSGMDVSNKILANAGLIDKKENNKTEQYLKNISCPMCNKLNSGADKYCKCGAILDLKEAQQQILSHKESFKAGVRDALREFGFDIGNLERR